MAFTWPHCYIPDLGPLIQPFGAKLQARRMVREADLNGDGKVSRDEFVNLLHETSVPDSLDQYDARLESTS